MRLANGIKAKSTKGGNAETRYWSLCKRHSPRIWDQLNWAAINKQTKTNKAYNSWDRKKLKNILKARLIQSQQEKQQNFWVIYSILHLIRKFLSPSPSQYLTWIYIMLQELLSTGWPYLGILQSTLHAGPCFCSAISNSQCLYLLSILIPSWETWLSNPHTPVSSRKVVWNLPLIYFSFFFFLLGQKNTETNIFKDNVSLMTKY